MAVDLLKDFRDAVRTRTREAKGVGFASDYVRTIAEVAGMAALPTLMPAAKHDWSAYVKSRENDLVFLPEDAGAFGGVSKSGNFGSTDGTITLTEKSCLDFDFVLTSTRRDRDRDILEPKGAEIDQSMPLLWQHIAIEPCGKYLKTLLAGDEKIHSRAAIADTKLGNDAAFLVEFGALRISHAFLPQEVEPISKGENGWRILKYQVVECSLVSIPSNVDAVITAYSKQKLFHPLVKLWAGHFFQERQKSVQGNWAPPAVNVTVNLGDYTSKSVGKKDETPPTPSDDGKKKEEEGAGGGKETPSGAETAKPLSEIADAIGKISSSADLPAEATNRIATLVALVQSAQESLAASAEAFSEAAATEEMGGVVEAMDGVMDGVAQALAKVVQEIGAIMSIAGLSDAIKNQLSEIGDGVQATLDSMMGSQMEAEPADPVTDPMADPQKDGDPGESGDLAQDSKGEQYSISATTTAASLLGMVQEGLKVHSEVRGQLCDAMKGTEAGAAPATPAPGGNETPN